MVPRPRLFLSLVFLSLLACRPKPQDTGEPDTDHDNDGFSAPEDCDDDDASTYPSAADGWYDGLDSDCAGNDDFDADGDGFVPDAWEGWFTEGVAGSGHLPAGDCWDDPATIPAEFTVVEGNDSLGTPLDWSQPDAALVHPQAGDTWYDGVDQDCDGRDDFDQDGDGYPTDDYPSSGGFGDDCIDDPGTDVGLDKLNPAESDARYVHPGAGEIWYDGTDQDCDANDCDRDGDGHAYPGSIWCASEDCDDGDPAVYADPEAEEVWYDGTDDDCDGNDGDQDGDGWWAADYRTRVLEAGGVPLTVPAGAEGDCWDDPADGASYSPLNGFPEQPAAAVYPGAEPDTWYDGIDQDCDGESDFDQDGDGHDADSWPQRDGTTGEDCADQDGEVNPGERETWYDGVDANCDGNDGDADGDGFYSTSWTGDVPAGFEAGDCDDADPAIHPGVAEDCDGVDQDCDGVSDGSDASGSREWYRDLDGDGYGDPESTVTECSRPDGYTTNASDCDDTSASIKPGGTEVCDDGDADEDCDGLADDADSASGRVTWYPDRDGDGFGDEGSGGSRRCDGSADYPVLDHSDCDDSAATSFPGADETCNAADDDCDGVTDEDAVDAPAWYRDGDGDGHGDGADAVMACAAPAGRVALGDDCDDDNGARSPDLVEACDDGVLDEDCDGLVDDEDLGGATGRNLFYPDGDRDGYGDASSAGSLRCAPDGDWPTADPSDCDDADDAVHPGATEVCNGRDDDCDGDTDGAAVDASTWYPDDDGDGFGASEPSVAACDRPAGHVADASDCDDALDRVYPGAPETCNGLDDDCDGDVDPTSAVDAGTWYRDFDGDGYGNDGLAFVACAPPEGFIPEGADCDDTAPGVNPGATEVCDEGDVDEDCDGLSDDADDASGRVPWYRDGDGDGYGTWGEGTDRCDGTAEYTTSRAGDCDDSDASASPGVEEVCDALGRDEDCDGAADNDDPEGASGMTTYYPDGDGDGYGDGASGGRSRCDADPEWTVTDGTDCDDRDPALNPGAAETCDGADQDEDCDGGADDADVGGALGKVTYHADVDGDGRGNPASFADQCDPTSSWPTLDSLDCDDSSASVNPDATEACDAGDVDEDCDGLADDGDGDATGRLTWYPDRDGDSYGDQASVGQERCDAGDGYTVLEATDCDDSASGTWPGATEVCDVAWTDEDCDGLADDDDAEGALGMTSHYLDGDEDGYGSETATAVDRCHEAAGWSSVKTDCDDEEALKNPGEAEADDDLDNDCDDMVDEGFRVAGDIIITEIMHNPYGTTGVDPNNSYVEIYNPNPTRDLYLDGMAFYVSTGSGYTVWIGVDGLVAPAGGYAVLCGKPTHGELSAVCDYQWCVNEHGTSAAGVTYYTSMWIDHSKATVRLSLGGVTLDEVSYVSGTGWPSNTDGRAIELSGAHRSATDNDSGGYWCRATTIYAGSDYGTPGADNVCATP